MVPFLFVVDVFILLLLGLPWQNLRVQNILKINTREMIL